MVQKIHPQGVIWGPCFHPQGTFFQKKSAECSVHLYSSPCLTAYRPIHICQKKRYDTSVIFCLVSKITIDLYIFVHKKTPPKTLKKYPAIHKCALSFLWSFDMYMWPQIDPFNASCWVLVHIHRWLSRNTFFYAKSAHTLLWNSLSRPRFHEEIDTFFITSQRCVLTRSYPVAHFFKPAGSETGTVLHIALECCQRCPGWVFFRDQS